MKRSTFVLVCLLAGVAFAADPPATDDRIRLLQEALLPPVLVRGETPAPKSLAARMKELNVPGVSIAVIDKGRIDWARGFGMASEGGAAVTADTLFQAASISKPVFALAVLRLADEGKLALDTDVNQYLRSWKIPANTFTGKSPVTFRRLLSHSAGTTVHGFPGYAAGSAVPTAVQVLSGTEPANTPPVIVDLQPGARFRYSGGGYTVAQLALADITGETTPRLLQDLVLTPLGMTRSTYEQPLPAARLAEVAPPHDGLGKPIKGGPHTYPEMAAAGLWTTPSDLARYAIGVQRAFNGEDASVIKTRTARAMLMPIALAHGIGPAIGGRPERKYFTHGGANAGYRCMLVAYTNGQGAVVMTNGDRGGELFGDIFRTIAQLYQWPDFAPTERTLAEVKPELFDQYVGAYLLNDGSQLVVRKDGARLIAEIPGQPANELFPSSETTFFAKSADNTVGFVVTGDKVTGAKYRTAGFERAGDRLDATRSRELVESAERTAKRIAEQKPLPQSEAAVRKLLTGLATGNPDYASMGPQLADLTRQHLPSLKKDVSAMGELRKVTFLRVGPRGADHFDADFEKGGFQVWVTFDAEGRVVGANLEPRQ